MTPSSSGSAKASSATSNSARRKCELRCKGKRPDVQFVSGSADGDDRAVLAIALERPSDPPDRLRERSLGDEDVESLEDWRRAKAVQGAASTADGGVPLDAHRCRHASFLRAAHQYLRKLRVEQTEERGPRSCGP